MLRQAVILVGGLGSRLGSFTADTPKPMLPVAGRPFLDYLIAEIARHGFEEVVLLARHKAGKIRDHYRGVRIAGVDIRVVEEKERAGTAGALREAADEIDETFLLCNGDSLFDVNLLALAQRHVSKGATVTMALREVEDTARYGRVTVGEGGRIKEFVEKSGSMGAGLINGGVYLVSRRIISDIGAGERSLETDILPVLSARGDVYGMSFDGYFIDIGIPETYKLSQTELPVHLRRKVVFLDRDGTLNQDDGYTYRPEDLRWMPGAISALRRCNDAGRLVIVVTNQAGIARGYYGQAEAEAFHRAMNRELQAHGAHIDAFYICPHHPEGTIADLSRVCCCRKPGTGLLEAAVRDWKIDLTGAVLFGDKPSDLEAAERFGIRGVLTDGSDLSRYIAEMEI